ncbi:ferredoxin/flavodoxin [Methanococcus voltae]|uniref:EFR1 family ferrodoxin n=1 Tax=Methanococcus voltae TaxID=2188 RepID=UPI001AEB775B|nr:EFR1 family ferrodoxin [Methanococcus voltae]MBP2144238.1 ferredoxin/flavodoxin [Methanococcus voltae]
MNNDVDSGKIKEYDENDKLIEINENNNEDKCNKDTKDNIDNKDNADNLDNLDKDTETIEKMQPIKTKPNTVEDLAKIKEEIKSSLKEEINVIYYFSGTGNSYYVARELAKVLSNKNNGNEDENSKANNTNTKIIPIANEIKKEQITCGSDKIIFVYPVYGFGVPEIVERFIKRLNIERNPKIYSIATCGKMAGGVHYHVDKLLKEKKQQLNAGYTIQMPSNYILAFNAPAQSKIIEILDDTDIRIKELGTLIQSNEKNDAMDSLIAKISTGAFYPFWKKSLYKFDEKFKISKACNLCGTCVEICPVNNIEIVDNEKLENNDRIIYKHKCQECMGCIQTCPTRAIIYGKSAKRKSYFNPRVEIKELIEANNGIIKH